MTTREQLEQEAEERYPLDRRQVMFSGDPFPRPEQAAFIAGRTVSAEQVEKAAHVAYEYERAETGNRWPAWENTPHEQDPMRDLIRAALRAAGFYIEGEE